MPDEAVEMRKQFSSYADAITAFATAQLIGFILLMTHGDCFTKNVLNGYGYAVCVGAVVNVGYFILVFLCHREANKIPADSLVIASAVHGVQMLRYVILVADLTATILLPLAINYGWHHARFVIDCRPT